MDVWQHCFRIKHLFTLNTLFIVIASHVRRYGIKHPVVNDVNIELWERLGITCWPTLVIIGPNRQLLHYIIGEGHSDEFHIVMDTVVAYYKDRLNLDDIPLGVGVTKMEAPSSLGLKYPGKVCLSEERGVLFISDSSNHRILSMEKTSGMYSYSWKAHSRYCF